MRLAKHRRKTRLEMDMTPMIDVAFQLIIFFMTVSQMSQANQEPMRLPKQAGLDDAPPRSLTVNVTETGEFRLAGEPASLAAVVSRIGQELQRVGDDPSRLNVVIRADERGQSRGVNEVVTALNKLRVTRVRIAVDAGGS